MALARGGSLAGPRGLLKSFSAASMLAGTSVAMSSVASVRSLAGHADVRGLVGRGTFWASSVMSVAFFGLVGRGNVCGLDVPGLVGRMDVRGLVCRIDVRSLDGLGDVRTSLSAASVAGMSAASPGTRSFVASLGTPMVALSIAGTFFIASIALPATAARKNARGVRGSLSSLADGRTRRLLRPGPPRVSCNSTGSTRCRTSRRAMGRSWP